MQQLRPKMASLAKTTLLKIISPSQGGKIAACVFIQNRGIKGKALRESLPMPPKKPKPFDYVNKDYTWLRSLFDRTTYRIDDNSKVIVVEGPIAVGKTKFAEALAADLDMKHFPEATMDYHYITPGGIDLRQFDPDIPEDTRTFDHRNFCCCPHHRLSANFQIMMYNARYGQYIDALAHLFNTGQGVVLERSPFSDFVFMETMYRQGFASKGARSVYYEIRCHTIEHLMRPHLVVYLDLCVNGVRNNIMNRCYPHEIQGTALSCAYLQEMERQYKETYLREISTHSELLVYDWSGGGDVEIVVEDIERVNFDQYTHRLEPKMKDWRLPREVEWSDQRMLYTNQKGYLMNLFNVPRTDVPELITGPDDAYAREKVLLKHPGLEYMEGYTAGGNLFKSKVPKYSTYL